MFTRTAYAVMAATAFTLSLALMSPVVAATAASAPHTTNSDAGATFAKASAVKTMFGTTALSEGGETLSESVARQDARYGRVRTLQVFFDGPPGNWARSASDRRTSGRRLLQGRPRPGRRRRLRRTAHRVVRHVAHRRAHLVELLARAGG